MKKFKFKIQGNPYEVEIKDFEENVALVEVNGTLYEVELQKELVTTKTPTLIRKPIKLVKDAKNIGQSSGLTLVKAPLPGNILQVTKRTDEVVNIRCPAG